MKRFQDDFSAFVRSQDLIAPGERLLVAVSGGCDSVALARLLKDTGKLFSIAHINHSLRGKESDGDARFVKSLAKKIAVPYHELKADTRGYCKKHGKSIQEGAREIRYRWLQETAIAHGYDKIVTAHQLDDSIESFFINLLRGTGIHGLTGIPVRNGNIIRPLLFASRSELKAYLKDKRMRFREDSSNKKDDYLRNRIRHHLIPMLLNLQPSFTEIMGANLGRLRMSRELADAELEKLRKQLVRKTSLGSEIAIRPVLEHSQPEELLFALLHPLGFEAFEPEKLLLTGHPGKRFRSGDKEVVRDRERLIVRDIKTEIEPSRSIRSTTRHLDLTVGDLFLGKRRYKPGQELELMAGQQLVDFEKLIFPLEVRKWLPGDRFRPLGMKQHRKVSDFLTDLKLSIAEKDRTQVIVQQGKIICILGHRISDDVKVTSATTSSLLIRWHTK